VLIHLGRNPNAPSPRDLADVDASGKSSRLRSSFKRPLRDCLARFFELFEVRRVLKRLVVLCERLFGVALFHEYVAQRLLRL
jgi:hypothetical protein